MRIGQQTRRDEPIEEPKGRVRSEAGGRGQHLIVQAAVPVQGSEDPVAEQPDDGVAGVPYHDLFVREPLEHIYLWPTGSFELT